MAERRGKTSVLWICGSLLALLAFAAVVGPWLLPGSYASVSPLTYAPPSWAHPFGTDLNGRDVLYRVLEGARVSLLVGLCGAALSLVIGTAYGLVAGYAGGRVDNAMMRFVDIFYSIPRLLFVLVLISAFNRRLQDFAAARDWEWLVDYSSIVILIVALGVIEWLTMARIVRGQVLALKTRPFVTAARALGQSHPRIIVRHLLPNLLGVIIVYLTLTIPAVIIDESFLSFLGLGVQAPQSSLGSLLSDGAQAINPVRNLSWLLIFPAAVMATTLLALNFLGDALRDLLDPRR
jgi:peptide/nickel transport system permease protein/oligopeptide transport system permease protein